MKKIGIITFQCAYNYGAVLQAYALKKVFHGYAEIINYGNDFFKLTNHLYVREKNIVKVLLKILYKEKLLKRTKRFEEFNHLKLTDNANVIKRNAINEIADSYDAYITGSDQVWNLDCTGNDTTYYLDFVKKGKRFSYAASFGKSVLSEKEFALMQSEIANYDLISVREASGIQLLKSKGIENVRLVLDPTLLMLEEEWKNSFLIERVSEKYIFVYNVTGGDSILNFAKKVAKEYDMKIYYITASIKPASGVKKIMDAGPIEWLNYIYNASFVITNSYHGCIFSMIFHKNFYVYFAQNNMLNSTRTMELLRLVGLDDSIRTVENEKIDVSTIDYTQVDEILDKYRKISLDYVKEIMKSI